MVRTNSLLIRTVPAQETSTAYRSKLASDQRNAKYRGGSKQGPGDQPIINAWYACNKCGELGKHYTSDCPNPELPADKKPKRENQMRGVPVSFYTRSIVPVGDDSQPQPGMPQISSFCSLVSCRLGGPCAL